MRIKYIKGFFFLSCCLFLASGSMSAASGAAEEKVKIRQLVGTVEIRMTGNASWRPARLAMVLKTGWDIRTFVESSAELEYESGTVIRLGENSVVTISALAIDPATNSTNTGIKVPVGQVWANVKKLTSTQSRFDFETPTAVASIRGTRLGINVVKGRTSVDVYEGTVMVRNRESGNETAIKTHEQAVIAQGQKGIVVSDLNSGKGGQKDKPVIDPFTGDTLKEKTADSTKSAVCPPDKPVRCADSSCVKSVDECKAVKDTTKSAKCPPDRPVRCADSSCVKSADECKAVKDTAKGAKCPADKPVRCDDGSCVASPDLCRGALKIDTTLVPLSIELTTPLPQTIITQTPVFVRGKTIPGVRVALAGKEAAVGSDGGFSDFVELHPGSNTIPAVARRGAESKTAALTVVFRPPLFLNVTNIIDNMEVVSSELDLDVEVSDGAQYSINGKTGVSRVALTQGKNQIVVTAWDQWNSRTEKTFFVTYKATTEFVLKIASPQDNITISTPMIPISGSTQPGATVTVNGTKVPVGPSGFFTTQLPIPDEPRDYTMEITARLGSEEKSEERTVTYAPPVKPIELQISSPVEDQVIKTSSIHIVGKTSEGATVKINGRPAIVSVKGLISMDLQVSEKDIGTYTLEAIASRDDQEMTKNISVKVDIASPQINTGVPRLQVTGLGRQATRTAQLALQVFDQTPNDQIAVTVADNGTTDNFTLDPGSRESIVLNEGKNKLQIRAHDLAGNQAQPIESQIYYLPGPLEISVIEPSENSVDIQDLPPFPRGAGSMSKIHFRVEIRDNIGTVPETVKYCRITSSSGQTVVLNNERDYFYYGDMPVGRGNTAFTIQVEDIAGTIQMKKIDMRINE
jgi:hypothetical protein